MKRNYSEKEIADARRMAFLFSRASEESKNMAIGYLSALADKEVADKAKKREPQEV